MRWTYLTMLATAGCLALAHCSSDDSAAGPTNGDDAGGGGDNDATAITDTGTGPNDAAIVDAAPAIVDVNGTLHDVNRNVAAGGKVVHVLDADGTLTTVTADANGKFQVKGVKTPYDVYVPIVYADGGEVGATGDYVVGITRDDPWISTSDITVAHHATYSITTTICSGCVFYYGFPSFGAKSANGTGASQTIDESVTWLGPATMSVDVTQLVKDATGTWITYGIGSRSFTDGATTSTPVASLGDALGANTNLTVTSTGPATYTAGGANVDLANEAGNRVGEASSPAGALKLPPKPAWAVDVTAFGSLTDGTTYAGFTRFKKLSDVPASIAFAMPAEPKLLTPADDAVDVLATDKLTWQGDPAATSFFVQLTDSEFHVLNATTSKPELDLARAKTIGVVLVSQDVYTWNASASMPRTVDTYTQPGGPAPLYGTATYSASTTTRTFRPK